MNKAGKNSVFEHVLSMLDLSSNCVHSILDFGCGPGDFLGLVSKNAGAKAKLFGIDASDHFIRAAKEKYSNIDFVCEKIDDKLDFPDAAFDRIVTIDVMECIRNKGALINEFHRILKPGGKVLAAHWDWDTMLYNTENKQIERKAVAAFSDWKQPWMDQCDGQMGRKLWGLFEGSGKFRGKPDSFNLIETTYEPGKYGFDRMRDVAQLIDKGCIGKEEYEKLNAEFTEQSRIGRYFFSLTSFLYWGEKPVSSVED